MPKDVHPYQNIHSQRNNCLELPPRVLILQNQQKEKLEGAKGQTGKDGSPSSSTIHPCDHCDHVAALGFGPLTDPL